VTTDGVGRRAIEKAFERRHGRRDVVSFFIRRHDGQSDCARRSAGFLASGSLLKPNCRLRWTPRSASICKFWRKRLPPAAAFGFTRASCARSTWPRHTLTWPWAWAPGICAKAPASVGPRGDLPSLHLRRFRRRFIDRPEILAAGARRGAVELGLPLPACRVVVVGRHAQGYRRRPGHWRCVRRSGHGYVFSGRARSPLARARLRNPGRPTRRRCLVRGLAILAMFPGRFGVYGHASQVGDLGAQILLDALGEGVRVLD